MRSLTTRRLMPVLAIGALVLGACGSDDEAAVDESEAPDTVGELTELDDGAGDGTDAGADESCSNTISDGVLTIATGEPAFFPWVIDDAPETGEGYEAAVAFAVAEEMGYGADSVTWVRSGFDEAIQPGAKDFDLNLQQFTITPERDETVDFSLPYYTSNQAVVALVGSAADGATSIADLKGVQLGAQVGTTSLTFITEVIQPDKEPLVYDDNVGAKAALEANQIDAAVFDLPTALFVSGVEIEGSAVIGQFSPDAGGTTDQFGFVLEDGNALKACVDAAITTLTDDGTLDALVQEWLADNTGAPFITL